MNLFQISFHCRHFFAETDRTATSEKLGLADAFLSLPTQAAELMADGRIRYQLSGLVGMFGAMSYACSEAVCLNRWELEGEGLAVFFESLARRSVVFELRAWVLDHDLQADECARWLSLRRLSPAIADIETRLRRHCHHSLRIIPFYPIQVKIPSQPQYLGINSFLAKTMVCRQSTILIQIGPMSIREWRVWWQAWGYRLEELRTAFPSGLIIKMACYLRDQVALMSLSAQQALYLGWNTLLNSRPLSTSTTAHCFRRIISSG